jgi:hypothetical protein
MKLHSAVAGSERQRFMDTALFKRTYVRGIRTVGGGPVTPDGSLDDLNKQPSKMS